MGFSNAPFLPDGTPSSAEQGRNSAPEALELAFRCRLKLMVRGLLRLAQPTRRESVLPERYLRLSPCRRTASVGRDNPRAQPISA